MRKRVFGKQLSRGRKAREALFKSLFEELILHGRIVTTKAKAKAIQGSVDKLVGLGKKNTVAARREAARVLRNKRDLIEILFKKVAPAFKQRQSGFTRMTLLSKRKGDGAQMASIEWVEKIEMVEPKAKEDKAVTTKGAKKVKKETVKKPERKTKKITKK
jgi:large subunit ribosomal protein L17